MNNNLFLFLLMGIPESVGLLLLVVVLLNKKVEWRKLIPMGTFVAVLIYLIRNGPFPFGVHSLFSLTANVIFLRYFYNVRLVDAAKNILIATFVLYISETALTELLVIVTKTTYQEAISQPVVWTLWCIPQVAVLWLLALIILYRRSLKKRPSDN